MKSKSVSVRLVLGLFLVYGLSCNGCYSYRVATHAQGSTDDIPANRIKAYSLFWGMLNNPQVITTPVCDSMHVNGVSEVVVKRDFGQAALTLVTLGIYCPVTVEWKCAKPCGVPATRKL